MNRTKTRLALLVASICLCTSVWAERVAPTFPDFTTLESGKTYYLYNVGTGKFLTRSTVSSTYPGVGTYGAAVTVAQASNGSYTLRFADGTTTYYLYAETSTTSSRSSVNDYCYFAIKDSLGGYVIQRSPVNTYHYVANEYVGYAEGATDDRIVPNLTEGNIVWQLMEVTVAERYFAEHKLYTALEAMNPYDYEIGIYEEVYTNPESTNEELEDAATTLTNGLALTLSYTAPEWADFPFLVGEGSDISSSNIGVKIPQQGIGSITGTVKVNQNSTLVYATSSNSSLNLSVYINGELVRTLKGNQLSSDERYFENLTAGTYHIEWRWENTDERYSSTGEVRDLGVEATPSVEVSLLEPGSLGTEVLYHVDHLKDVRRLKVKGKMNDDDWAKIEMMTNLFALDLSETDATKIPDDQFYRSTSSSSEKCVFLNEVILPNALESIGDDAFHNSLVETLTFPSTLENIGYSAFSYSHITEAILPDSMTSIGEHAFSWCKYLTTVNYPKDLTYVPAYCFSNCNNLNTFTLPYGLEVIDNYAFSGASKFNPRLPETLTTMGLSAFSNCATDSLFVPESLTTWRASYTSNNAFSNNSNLVYAEFPTSFYRVDWQGIVSSCGNLHTLVFKSPTVVLGEYKSSFLDYRLTADNLTIKVPSFLVNSYKLDEYWYNYKIEGFNTADIKDWNVRGGLVLNHRERIEGNPNVSIGNTGSIKVNGENAQAIDTLNVYVDHTKYNSHYNNTTGAYEYDFYYGQLWVRNDASTISGAYMHHHKVEEKKWYFLSLPFDFTVGEVTNDANAKLAIRYYDGASRATEGAVGNWKNYAAEDVIKAGTGFIVQASAATTLTFRAMDNESKQYVVSNEEFVKALDANPSEILSNRGWNLVGNPWQCYFNIHTLNFTAPITVYDIWNKTYTAYSIIDDDYAIRPNEAFFVQCPEGTEYISFPETGRQLTSEITNQSSAPAKRTAAMGSRQLVDVAISAGDLTDKTRVVLNEAALMEYETACDASKFFTMDAGVPQIYTLDSEATEYAINERPVGNGNVQLGVVIAASGKHTISMPRNDAKTVVLIDHVAGTTHDLSLGEYTFTAEAGTYNGRFTLSISKAHTTAIDEATATDFTVKSVENAIVVSGAEGMVTVFTIDGRKVAEQKSKGSVTFGNLLEGSYLVRTVNGTSKVTVK